MMRAGTETGSAINHIYSRVIAPEPTIGMGATILSWTDRHAATIVKTTPKTLTVQYDTATRIDKNGMSESQTYAYEANSLGVIDVFRLTKRGWRNKSGQGLLIGKRESYHDYSF